MGGPAVTAVLNYGSRPDTPVPGRFSLPQWLRSRSATSVAEGQAWTDVLEVHVFLTLDREVCASPFEAILRPLV